MLRVALTGNIASGKSQVEKILKTLSVPVIDADEIVAGLYCDKEFLQKMSVNFKDYNFIKEDEINREKLADIVFTDSEFKKKLENFVHPFVLEKIEKFFADNSLKPVVVASIPLLFESGWQKYFDKSILVISALKNRQERLMARNKLTFEQAKIRINAQMLQEEKIGLADYILDNSCSLEELNVAVKSLLEMIYAEL